MQLRRASCQHFHSIMATVPKMVSTPEKREGRDWEMVVERFSTSLVIRLITSPWEWVSMYRMGRSTSLPKSWVRIRSTMRWLSRALNSRWSREQMLYRR